MTLCSPITHTIIPIKHNIFNYRDASNVLLKREAIRDVDKEADQLKYGL